MPPGPPLSRRWLPCGWRVSQLTIAPSQCLGRARQRFGEVLALQELQASNPAGPGLDPPEDPGKARARGRGWLRSWALDQLAVELVGYLGVVPV